MVKWRHGDASDAPLGSSVVRFFRAPSSNFRDGHAVVLRVNKYFIAGVMSWLGCNPTLIADTVCATPEEDGGEYVYLKQKKYIYLRRLEVFTPPSGTDAKERSGEPHAAYWSWQQKLTRPGGRNVKHGERGLYARSCNCKYVKREKQIKINNNNDFFNNLFVSEIRS